MNKGVLYLVASFGITLVLSITLGWFLTKTSVASVDPVASQTESITEEDLRSGSSQTNSLKNYGDLPLIPSADQLGRENPFSSY